MISHNGTKQKSRDVKFDMTITGKQVAAVNEINDMLEDFGWETDRQNLRIEECGAFYDTYGFTADGRPFYIRIGLDQIGRRKSRNA